MIKRLGFTLLELLVVIAILGFIATIAIAALESARNDARIAGGLQFQSSLHQAVGSQHALQWLMEDFAGSISPDTSGGNLNGAVLGSTAIIADPDFDNVATFDGVGDGIVYSPASTIYQGPFTVSMWVKSEDANDQNNTGVFANRDTINNPTVGVGAPALHSFQIGVSNVGAQCSGEYRYRLTVNAIDPITPAGVSYNLCYGPILNDWQHLVATFDGANLNVFTDGQLSDSVSIPVNVQFNAEFRDILVGINRARTRPFNGRIDNANVYFEALPISKIESLYAEGLEKLKLAGE